MLIRNRKRNRKGGSGKVIVDVVNSGNIPGHLPLGSDAVKIISTELKSRLREVEGNAKISVQTDFEE